jgi:hypothetical protein
MWSTGNDFSHCLHGSPIVEKPPFSEKFELISGSLVEAFAKKYDSCKDKADCYPNDEGNYVAQMNHINPSFLPGVELQSLCPSAPVGGHNLGMEKSTPIEPSEVG